MKNTFDFALKYKEKGFAVIPLSPNSKIPIKEMTNWPNLPKPTDEELKRWFENTNNNIGIRCGKISNLICIDVDLKNLVAEGKTKPHEEIESLPPTLRAKTVNGGWHYFYKYPSLPFSSSKGKQHPEQNIAKTKGKAIPDLDLQSDGTYVVVAPSEIDGKKYQWDKPAEIADFPIHLFPKQEKTIQTFNNGEFDELKDRIKITELAKHLGFKLDRNNKSLCPWHNETKPSLSFSDKLRGYTCFGCNESGDIFTLYQKMKGRDFKEALKELSEFAGMPVERAYFNSIKSLAPRDTNKPWELKELLNEDFGEVKWLIEPFISENSITILSGAPGQYKSYIALHAALCLAGNKPLFGNFPIGEEGIKVMIVDEENNRRRIQKRLKQLGTEEGQMIYFRIMENIFLDAQTIDKLIAEMKELDVKFVIFDSLVRFFNFEENSSKEINQAYMKIKRFLQAGISVLFIHHHRKQGPFKVKTSDLSAVSESMRGSTDILAMCDTHLAVMPVERGVLALIQTKSRDTELQTPIKISVLSDEDGNIEMKYEGEFDEESDKKERAKENIFKLIMENPNGLEREEIIQILKGVMGRTLLVAVLSELVKENKIQGKTKKELGYEVKGHELTKKVYFVK